MVRNKMDEDRSGSRSPISGVSRSGSRNSLNNGHCSTRTSSVHLYQVQGAKHVCFFRNGDLFYQGLKLAVSSERYKEFDSLLGELSKKMDLTTGAVRHIFDAEDGRMITDISQLQHGTAYVCSSTPNFDKMDGKYGKWRQQWSLHTKGKNQCLTNWGDKAQSKFHKKHGTREHAAKLVTVFKNGKPPQKKVTMILNHKFISLDQVLDLLSAKETLGKVDKLFTKCGTRQIKELDELFEDDTTSYTALSANERFFDVGLADTTSSHRTPSYRDVKRPSTGGLRRSSSVRTPRKRRDSGGSQSGDSGRHPVRRSQSVKGTNSGRSSRGRSESPGPLQNGHSPRSKSPKSPISPGKKTPNGMGNGHEELYPAQVFEKDSSDTEHPDSSNGINDQAVFSGM